MPCVLVFCVIWFFSSAPLGFPSPTPRFQGLGCLGFRRRVGVSRLAGLCCFAPPSLPPSCLCPAAQVRFLRRFGRRELRPGPHRHPKASFGFWVLGSGFWVVGSGFWVLGSGSWVLGFGFWLHVSV